MTFDALALLKGLTEEEVGFLANALGTKLLMYQPHSDPLVSTLEDRGFISAEPDLDPSHVLLTLSEKGRAVAQLVRNVWEHPTR